MTPLVIDACIAVKWFVREEHDAAAACLLTLCPRMYAPDFVLVELANILWKKCMRGEVSHDQIAVMFGNMQDYIPNMIRSDLMVPAAIQIAVTSGHSVYDCLYLACAMELGGLLVTADRRLKERLRGVPLSSRIVYVTECERAVAFAGLDVSLSTIEDVIRLAELSDATSRGVRDQLTGNRKFLFLPAGAFDLPSPNHTRLVDAIARLTAAERGDLLTLARMGDALPVEEQDWTILRSRVSGREDERHFLGYMQPDLLRRGLERFFHT